MPISTYKIQADKSKILCFFICVVLINFLFSLNLSAQNSKKTISFREQNKNSNYISFSFGMGILYSNNPSLTKFIELDVPNYTFIPNEQTVSSFTTGIQFFGGAEFQLTKKFSVKSEYAYLIKSIDVPTNKNYQYSYFTHQPMIQLYYIFLQDYSYIKFGIGGGYFISRFIRKERVVETKYTSSGTGIKAEGIFNAQLGKSAAVYLCGFLMNSFMSDLKNENGNHLLNLNNEKVNLSSFGAGFRLGVEVFIF
ncbi:MAG: hypothetical protein ABIY50_10430 [Ignavibacteria bacterium]